MAKKSTELSTTEDVSSMVKLLDLKIKSLEHISDTKYKTGGDLDGFGNIHKENKIENLIKAFSSVDGREKGYNNSAMEMGLTTYPQFEVNGRCGDDWKHDIQLRVAIINHKEELDKLNAYRERVQALMTKEEQKRALFAEMSEYLSNK